MLTFLRRKTPTLDIYLILLTFLLLILTKDLWTPTSTACALKPSTRFVRAEIGTLMIGTDIVYYTHPVNRYLINDLWTPTSTACALKPSTRFVRTEIGMPRIWTFIAHYSSPVNRSEGMPKPLDFSCPKRRNPQLYNTNNQHHPEVTMSRCVLWAPDIRQDRLLIDCEEDHFYEWPDRLKLDASQLEVLLQSDTREILSDNEYSTGPNLTSTYLSPHRKRRPTKASNLRFSHPPSTVFLRTAHPKRRKTKLTNRTPENVAAHQYGYLLPHHTTCTTTRLTVVCSDICKISIILQKEGNIFFSCPLHPSKLIEPHTNSPESNAYNTTFRPIRYPLSMPFSKPLRTVDCFTNTTGSENAIGNSVRESAPAPHNLPSLHYIWLECLHNTHSSPVIWQTLFHIPSATIEPHRNPRQPSSLKCLNKLAFSIPQQALQDRGLVPQHHCDQELCDKSLWVPASASHDLHPLPFGCGQLGCWHSHSSPEGWQDIFLAPFAPIESHRTLKSLQHHIQTHKPILDASQQESQDCGMVHRYDWDLELGGKSVWEPAFTSQNLHSRSLDYVPVDYLQNIRTVPERSQNRSHAPTEIHRNSLRAWRPNSIQHHLRNHLQPNPMLPNVPTIFHAPLTTSIETHIGILHSSFRLEIPTQSHFMLHSHLSDDSKLKAEEDEVNDTRNCLSKAPEKYNTDDPKAVATELMTFLIVAMISAALVVVLPGLALVQIHRRSCILLGILDSLTQSIWPNLRKLLHSGYRGTHLLITLLLLTSTSGTTLPELPSKSSRNQERYSRRHNKNKTPRIRCIILRELPRRTRWRLCERLTRRQFMTMLYIAAINNTPVRVVTTSPRLQDTTPGKLEIQSQPTTLQNVALIVLLTLPPLFVLGIPLAKMSHWMVQPLKKEKQTRNGPAVPQKTEKYRIPKTLRLCLLTAFIFTQHHISILPALALIQGQQRPHIPPNLTREIPQNLTREIPQQDKKQQDESFHFPPTRDRMQIFIKTPSGKTLSIDTNPNDTIKKIKEIIHDKEGIDPCQQRLVRVAKQLCEKLTLADYNIQNEETIDMFLRLKGGKAPSQEPKPTTTTQHTIRTMTLNIRQGSIEKMPLVLDHLLAQEIDVAFITETGSGANLSKDLAQATLNGGSYVAHQAPLEDAGVTILLRTKWNHRITKTTIIQKGRVLALTLVTPEGAQIILVGVYQKTGLDTRNNEDPEVHRAQANIDRIIDLMDNRETSLVICGGDFNETNSNTERIRASREPSKPRKRDATFTTLLGVGFTDTHDQGEMTCTTQTQNGPSLSRIDKIFVWSNSHMKITETAVETVCYPHTHVQENKKDVPISDHNAVYTEIQTAHTPGHIDKAYPQPKQVQTRHATKETKEDFATQINETLEVSAHDLINRIQNWETNLPDSNKAIEEFIYTVNKKAEKHFGTTNNHHGHQNIQETKTRIRLRNLAKILRQIETLQNQNRDKFKKRKTQSKYKKLLARLPKHIQEAKAPLDTSAGKKWVTIIRTEKKAKLTKLHTDRQIRKRNHRVKLNPQDEALKAKRQTVNENITTITQTERGKVTLTTDPTKVKKEVRDHFYGHMGKTGPKPGPIPTWLKPELSHNKYKGTYTLDEPFTKQELHQSLATAKNSASPGKDGLAIAILKFSVLHAPEGATAASDILLTIAQAVYDAAGKHDTTKAIVCKPLYKKAGDKSPTNLRPIALQNAIAKIPSKLLATRLTNDLNLNGAIHNANEGFLKGKNTGNALTTVVNIWEDAKEFNKPCYCLSYDVSKAYDHLRWFTIKQGMQRINLPEKFQDYILGKMKESTIEFKTHYGNTTPFEIKRGTAQGCPLSPLIYIISMDLMHAGLHKNPLYDSKEDGYRLEGGSRTIADKCYADDTFLLARSENGLTRMNTWVNTFCEYNYISMNPKKTKLFGLDKNRNDIHMTLPVVQHGEKGKTIKMTKSQSASIYILHLGLWMNMHLDWSRAESDIASTIGWYKHLINANSLSAEAALYLTNKVLTPKIEYRLRFFSASKERMKIWDKTLKQTITNTYNNRIDTQKQALATITGLVLPSQTQQIASVTHLQRTLAQSEQSDATYTTNRRLHSTIYPLQETTYTIQSSDPEEPDIIRKHINWSRAIRIGVIKTLHISLQKTVSAPLPEHYESLIDNPEQQATTEATFQGETIKLPTSWYGTWGHNMPQKQVQVYTDGSRKVDTNSTNAAWAAVLHDDAYEQHWEPLHEKYGRKPRTDHMVNTKIPNWFGAIPKSNSSYNTELEAITRMSMILPSTWQITIWTDSKSSMDRIEALRKGNDVKKMKEPEWELLSLFMHIEKMRKEPIQLRHIKSHTQGEDIISVGNATADLVAEAGRLFASPKALYTNSPFLPALAFHRADGTLINTCKALRNHIYTHVITKQYDPWKDSNTQAEYLQKGFKPVKTYEYFLQNLKGRHTGTLLDVLTGGITKPSYRPSTPAPHCLYCKHVRKNHQTKILTPEHLTWCCTNRHAQKNMKAEIRQQVISTWEPELKQPHKEIDDETLKVAQNLVNLLQTKRRSPKSKLSVYTERGWIGPIWPWDLDKLAIRFVTNRTAIDLPIDYDTWQNALTQFLVRSDCGCQSTSCSSSCRLATHGSPPTHFQALAHTLIEADTMRYANVLQQSPALKHVINEDGADRMWGSQGSKERDTHKGNYYYSPPCDTQLNALQTAAEHKRTGSVSKTMGLLRLDLDTQKEIQKGDLTLIATIPKGNVKIQPHPSTRRPTSKDRDTYQYGLVLGIHSSHKSLDKKEILIAIHTMRHWKKTLYPRATINEQALYKEITGRKDNCSYNDKDWHDIITQTWKWIDSPTGTQGLLYKTDQAEIATLKGSRKYEKAATQIALKQFVFFAQDWEDKNNLLPPHARKWWNQKKYEPRFEDEENKLKRKTPEEKQEQQEHRKKLRTQAFSVQRTITYSADTLLQASRHLVPDSTIPNTHQQTSPSSTPFSPLAPSPTPSSFCSFFSSSSSSSSSPKTSPSNQSTSDAPHSDAPKSRQKKRKTLAPLPTTDILGTTLSSVFLSLAHTLTQSLNNPPNPSSHPYNSPRHPSHKATVETRWTLSDPEESDEEAAPWTTLERLSPQRENMAHVWTCSACTYGKNTKTQCEICGTESDSPSYDTTTKRKQPQTPVTRPMARKTKHRKRHISKENPLRSPQLPPPPPPPPPPQPPPPQPSPPPLHHHQHHHQHNI
jgi:large subunit ribosomal protein L40e